VGSIVFNSDCVEGMKQFPDKYFDLAIVDPPYGIDRGGQPETFTKNPKHKRRQHTQKDWDNERPPFVYWEQLFRVSKNQIVWGANYFTNFLPPSMGWIFWDKGQDLSMSDGELAFTSFEVALRRKIINRVEILKDGAIHPTQKPIKLYDWLYFNYATEGQKVLDTHLGSGSNRISAHKYKMDFTAFEIDKEYFDKQEQRYRDFISQTTLF
jgi:site-specific DNA-methyltransferase (adenine-specific)